MIGDEQALVWARTHGHGPRAEHAVARFSSLGEHGALWLAIAAGGAALGGRRRRGFRAAGGAVALAYFLNAVLKLLVRRRRPAIPGLPPLTPTPTRLSFPSAHASTGFAGALGLSRAGLPAAPLYCLAGALALSRVYLGVHYPSDALAGAALGSGVALVACRGVGREGPP
jgi:decaprenylphosphoryl-5-phosphoribose phosphatase